MNKKLFISFLAVVANLFLSIGKIMVGVISKSASVLADGVNSGTDVMASLISLIGIKVSEKPADKKHPYGHQKAEVLAGFVITLIILISALWIIYDAVKSFIYPTELAINYLAFTVMGISALTNAVMSYTKIYYGKKYNSVSLISDGVHSRIDLIVSIGIFLGLFLIPYISHIDSILALLVGVYILRESFSLGRETADSLLDSSAGEEIENKIKEILKKQKIEVSELKTQKRGFSVTANIKIKLPNNLNVEQATKISDNLKQTLINKIESLEYISLQIESHDVSTSFYKPALGLGRGFGWQGKARFKQEIPEAKGAGPEGNCVCPKCGYEIKHKRGVPCSTIKCSKCKTGMVRK